VPPRGFPFPIYADAGQLFWFNDAGVLNPTTGPNANDLFRDNFEDLANGFKPGNPFSHFFANAEGNLIQPVTDHTLRDNPFTRQFNPKDYLPKLATLAKVPLPAPPQ
jgi:hypothetical protein